MRKLRSYLEGAPNGAIELLAGAPGLALGRELGCPQHQIRQALHGARLINLATKRLTKQSDKDTEVMIQWLFYTRDFAL